MMIRTASPDIRQIKTTLDELVAWFRAEIDKAETSGEPQPFDAEAFKTEMTERHGRPAE